MSLPSRRSLSFRALSAFLAVLILNINVLGTTTSFAQENQDSEISRVEAESAASIEQLGRAIHDPNVPHRLDAFSLLPQEVYPTEQAHLIQRRNLQARTYRIVGSQGQVIRGLELLHRGQVLHRFARPVSDVSLHSHYLVFIEEGSHLALEKVQNLSFVDLRFFSTAIGRTALPVFRIPVEASSPITKLESLKHALKAGDHQIDEKVFAVFSDAQQLQYNVAANLVDPQTYEDLAEVVDDFHAVFQRAVDLQGDIEPQLNSAGLTRERLLDFSKSAQGSLQELKKDAAAAIRKEGEKTLASSAFAETLQSVRKNQEAQRRLVPRIQLMMARLTYPQPMHAPKIRSALTHVATALKKGASQPRESLQEALRHLVSSSRGRWTATAVAATAFGATHPVEIAHFLHEGLEISATMGEMAFGKAKEVFQLGTAAAQTTFSGLKPSVLRNAYFTTETFPKFATGLTAMMTTIYVSLGLPHVIVNTVQLVKDLKKMDLASYTRDRSWVSGLKRAFVDRQNRKQDAYLDALSQDTQKAADAAKAAEVFSEEDAQEVQRIIAEYEEQNRSWFSKLFPRWSGKKVVAQAEGKPLSQIQTFRGALSHFFFSYCSLTDTGYAYTKIWNAWFGFRAFIFKPLTFFTVLAYPNYFSVVTRDQTQVRIPSAWDGGQRNLLEQMRLKIFAPGQLKRLQDWEEKALVVESEIQEAVLRKAYSATLDFTDNLSDLKKLYSQGPIATISDRRVDQLSGEQRKFFRVYFNRLHDAAMDAFVANLLKQDGQSESLLEEGATPVKLGTEQAIQKISFTAAEAKALVEQAATPELFQAARASATQMDIVNPAGWIAAVQHRLASSLSPENSPQVKRIQAVNRQMSKPQAMARAVRSMRASLLIDKPMELFFTFALLAGVDEGILKPIQNELFADNSWFHLSKYVFTNGFIYGTVSSALADVWLKLQMDELNEGNFGKVPEGPDAKGTFAKWYLKNTFTDPLGNWWKNQKHYTKLIWANMKPALAMTLVVNLVTLGRFDLDAYISSYLVAYLLPNQGINSMMEQGFDLSTGYYAKIFPERLRAHPAAQEYLTKRIGNARLWFNLKYRVYENVTTRLVDTFAMMSHAAIGSRALSRIVFFGFTPTALVVRGLEWTSEFLNGVPGMSSVTNFCRKLLTRNYTGWEQGPPKKGSSP